RAFCLPCLTGKAVSDSLIRPGGTPPSAGWSNFAGRSSADGGVPPGRARPRAFPLPGPVVDKSGSQGGRPAKSGRPLLPQEHAADPKERLNFMPAPTRFILLAAGACLFGWLVLLTSADHEPKPKPVTFEDYPFIEPKGYVCYRAASPLVIDGKLNDE